jgi:hypothetical protein
MGHGEGAHRGPSDSPGVHVRKVRHQRLMNLDPSSPAFIALFIFLTFLVYGGWALFRRPKK